MSGQLEQLFIIQVPEGSEGVGTQNLGGTGMGKVGEHLERLLPAGQRCWGEGRRKEQGEGH